LYELGILPKKDYKNILTKMKDGDKIKLDNKKIKTKDLLGHEFKALIPADFYKKENNKYKNIEEDDNEKKKIIENAYKIKIVGIARAKKDSETNQTNTAPLGFTSKFTDQMIKRAGESQIVKDQENNKDINILNNIAFKAKNEDEKRKASKSYLENLDPDQKLKAQSFLLANSDKLKENIKKASMSSMNKPSQNQGQNMDIIGLFLKDPEDKVLDKLYDEELSSNSYQNNLEDFGYVSKNTPSEIKIYVENFENRDKVKKIIDDFNKNKKEKDKIHYTDFVGLFLVKFQAHTNLSIISSKTSADEGAV
jgi:putative ABC transport system permease protein